MVVWALLIFRNEAANSLQHPQIAHRTCAGGDGFFDFVVGNGVADADKHNVLRVFFRSVLIVCFILKHEYK